MAPSQIPRPVRTLNLPEIKNDSAQNGDEEKGDRLVKETFELLDKGEREIRLDEAHRDVILVLGNTGSGKSTFTQWIAGDNTKLISKGTEEGTGEYTIEDQNRIGNTTLKSKTVFPELVVDAETDAAYYDCPGFSDTQGTSHDIASTYFVKRVIDFSASLKMVFIVSHPSVRKGVDRRDFMNLVRHVTDLVKDIDKFKHSIALVATKVDNQYVRKGNDFILVEDDKVVALIAQFLQEAKRYLEDSLKIPNLSEKENEFYTSAIRFVEILLEKKGENYSKIGLFRRPDEPGPVSDIASLQSGKKDIEGIVYENLNFSPKTDDDFGYTISEKTKNDINEIVEEINKDLWSCLGNIAGNIQEYYRNLVDHVREKIHLFVSEENAVDVNSSEAKEYRHKLSSGYNIISELVSKLNNVKNPEKLAVLINSTASNSDFDILADDILCITNQGKYFRILQTVSDKTLSSKPWYQLIKDVETYLSGSETVILNDINRASEKINNRIQSNLNITVKAIQEEYMEKIKFLEIQVLPEKLNRDRHGILELTEEAMNRTTIEKLVNVARYFADNLGVSSPKEILQNVSNQGKYLTFLEIMANESLSVDPMMWLSPFKNIANYFYESEKWYTFLSDLYNKFSEYEIQKSRQRYNVADLEDWGRSGKPQGISVTPTTFEKFLSKIENYNVSEYETIKTQTTATTGLQIDELNQVLSLTLKHRPTVRCARPSISIKGTFISLNETMQNLISNSDTNNSCDDFEAQLDAGTYSLFQVFALNRVFIDTDLSFSGKRVSVAIVAPKWEVVGSRLIDLSGADGAPQVEPQAKNGARPGSDGGNGIPGKPGVSGESFFGIGLEFVEGVNLKIYSSGGNGGGGQNGGQGAPGRSGRDAFTPSDSDPHCKEGRFEDFKCDFLKQKEVNANNEDFFTFVDYKIYGLPGGRGGNGGDGGKGGRGGDPGNITLLELNRPSDIAKFSPGGEEGETGKAGAGSEGGKNGNGILAQWTEYRQTGWGCLVVNCVSTYWKWVGTIKETSRNTDGIKGTDGKNVVGQQDPIAANGVHGLPNIINDYKIFLRENINNRFEKHLLLQFLEQAGSSKDVRKLYDTLALINEFKGLEEQFHTLRDTTEFNIFYGSLLENIREFAKSQREGPDSDENRKVLNYLYTATLGRISDLKKNSDENLIIYIRKHLNSVEENIHSLRDLQTMNNRVDVINKYKENYKKGIERKIEEAKSLIEKHISPEIQNISNEIDDEVNSLIEETITLEKQAEKDLQKMKDKKEELGNALAMRGMFSLFHIIGGVVSFLGPIGEIAGTVIEATTTVAESLALNKQQNTFNLPADVLSAIASIGDKIKTMKSKKVAYLNKLLDDISEEIKKNPEKLGDLAGKIASVKDKLQKISDKKLDFKQVGVLENELKEELERKGEDLKLQSGDRKSADALKVIGKMAQIFQFGSLLLDIYDEMRGDEDKMEAVNDAMKDLKDKLKKLRTYEENIYEIVIPMLQEMEDHMKDIGDKLGTRSQVALDVTKWQVQSALKDMRSQMERLTETFEVSGDLSRSIEKMSGAMTTLINTYDRIQNYQDQQNRANYIADISSVAASTINITNHQFGNAVNHLEFAITANIILEQYKSGMDAFKQWVFPFADQYIDDPMLPSQLELGKNIESLVEHAAREIGTMRKRIDEYDAAITSSEQHIECEEFNDRYVSTRPFFEWESEKFGSSISNLLSGKEVVLKADVERSAPNKDAIKFSEIDFHFKTKNRTAQSLLYETLKGFDVQATHLGSSYYRFSNEIFLITSNSLKISYSYENNDEGLPLRSNEAYNILRSSDLLLSPYTLWEVKLINKPNVYNYAFEDLKRFRNGTDLLLSGFGRYVDMTAFRPTSHKSENSISSFLRSESRGKKECDRSKHRLTRSVNGLSVVNGDFATNVASKTMPSPINILCNYLSTYLMSNVVISINRIFLGKKASKRNGNDGFDLSGEYSEITENGSKVVSNPAIKADAISVDSYCQRIRKIDSKRASYPVIMGTVKVDATAVKENCKEKRSRPKFDTISNVDSNRSNNSLTEVPDLNCSLLLADLVTRTVTGNRYKSTVLEGMLSPKEVMFGKIRDGVVRSEGDIKRLLQRHLSEREEKKRSSWFSEVIGYAKAMLQFLGLLENFESQEYVEEVRLLFA